MKKFLLIFTLIFSFSVLVSGVDAATLILTPSSGSVSSGQTISVDIMLDTKGEDIDGVDVYSLNYNPAILEVVDSSSSASGVQITPGSLFPITLTNKVTSGVIQFSQVTSGGTSYKGSGKLATITFKGIANGTASVTFNFTPGSTSDTNVAGGGSDKLTSVGSGSYTVSGGNNPPPPPPPVADTTAPVISGISSSGIKSTSANIVWTTDESSDTTVEYGATTSYGSVSTSATMLTLHSRSLTNLKPATVYNYRVKSKDSSGNIAVSSNYTFTTLAGTSNPPPTPAPTPAPTPTPTPTPGTRPTPTPNPTPTGTGPKISSIYTLEISSNSAIVTWKTDRPTNSKLEYGKTDNYESNAQVNNSLATSHSVTLTNLSPETVYHYRIRSTDESGNLTLSNDKTFTTIKVVDKDMNFIEKIWDWFISLFI
ncbi:MAG: penicillin-resistant dd-carboxypeptidase-like protein [Parcubacteria bacterium C7867-003]|nr:MAG: penicillin-resistant dd-carboxypeptidase-like protein [Parcubacteria bacterium C7867-003]